MSVSYIYLPFEGREKQARCGSPVAPQLTMINTGRCSRSMLPKSGTETPC